MAEKTIGKRLREALARTGLSLKALSDKAELQYSSVQNYAADKQYPGAEALMKIRRATDISIDWLLTGEGAMLSSAVATAARPVELTDYQRLRSEFSNFDAVFSINPYELEDWKNSFAKGEPSQWHGVVWWFKFQNPDVYQRVVLSVGQGRPLSDFSEAEARLAAHLCIELLELTRE